MSRIWQPIETAPKDETEILLYCVDKDLTKIVHGYYKPQEGYPKDDFQIKCSNDHKTQTTDTIKPTHWMPLPKAPITK